MTGKNFMRRLHTMIVSLALASLLWSCAGLDRSMVAKETPYAEFPYQGVKALLDAAHSAAVEKPDFGNIKSVLVSSSETRAGNAQRPFSADPSCASAGTG